MVAKSKSDDKMTCFKCEQELKSSEFYDTKSILYEGVKKLPICKSCVNGLYLRFVEKFKDEKIALYEMCRKLDMPFHNSIFEGASKKKGSDISKHYFRVLNSFRDKNGYSDDFDSGDILNEEMLNTQNYDTEVEEDVRQYWGQGMDDWEYEFLENDLFRLKTDFECNDYGMEMIMKDIAFINLDIQKNRLQSKDVSKLIKTRSDLMNDANLKPVQSTGANQNEKLSLGVFIKKWENEKPVKKQIDDEMKRYIDTFMVGHLAKMQGIENDFTREYDKLIEDHTIDFEEIYSNKDGDE